MIIFYRTLQKKSFNCKTAHIIEGKPHIIQFYSIYRKNKHNPVIFSGEVVIGSGPKGRGFESRHFDQEENPGSVRLPGFFLFPGNCGKDGEKVKKLGERSGKKSREALYINTSGLGEMGEISTADLVKHKKNRPCGRLVWR